MPERIDALFDDGGPGARLQECLDARRDPLDDPALCEWLLDHPDALPAFAILRHRLQLLQSAPRAAIGSTVGAPRRWRRRAAPFAALALATAALGGWLARAPATTAPGGRVLSWQVDEQRSGPSALVTAHQAVVETDRTRLVVTESWRIRR